MIGLYRLIAFRPLVLVLAGTVILASHGTLQGANAVAAHPADEPHRLKVLFLGDQGLHRPVERMRDAAPAMLDRGIELVYTEDLNDLNPTTLQRYDALLLYANHRHLSEEREQALLEYVENGGGFVPLHSASNNFLNSPAFIELVGGEFDWHGDGVMTTLVAEPEHPVMIGFEPFETWDETRVHRNHNEENRTVLSYHERDDGELEPWTWVREQGRGRVFYTSWGHNEQTWRHAGFHDLLERGIRWAAGQDVQQVLAERPLYHPLRYREVEVYPPPPPRLIQTGGEPAFLDEPLGEENWNLQAEPLSPEESMRRMITPAGFRVELFAAEPDVVNPISIAWDERGRLWVVESVDYPHNLRGGEPGNDKIKILEDTTGDGRADTVTVFADDLNIPTSLAFHNGGVIVKQAPHTLFMKDTTGDGKADHREILIEGWSQRDTHGGPNNIRYGFDNHIWGTLGMSGFRGSVGGQDFPYTANDVFRMTPDGSKLEFIRSQSNNSWGMGFSEEGVVFATTANAEPSTFKPFPQRYYDKVDSLSSSSTESISTIGPRFLAITDMLRQNNVYGGFTAAGGHALYTARAYPPEFWNRKAFVTDITGHLTGSFVLEPNGSSFESFNKMNLIAGDDAWFSPVAAEVGPDGAVWIADLYEYISQHMVPGRPAEEHGPGEAYVTDLRDNEHGRIYRIVWEGAEPYEPLDLSDASPAELVETLGHDNMLWRMHAQRLLVERGQADVAGELIALVNAPDTDAIGLNVGAIHALWTLHGLGQLESGVNGEAAAAVHRALAHPSAGVRRNAVQVLPPEEASVENVLSTELLSDANAQVRLRTLVALADMPPSSAAGRAIFEMLENNENIDDRWIREAGTIAAAVHNAGFLEAARVLREPDPAETEQGLENLLPNPSFEEVVNGRPAGWTVRTYAGSADHELAEGEGRGGGNALKISSTGGADTSWYAEVDLKANTRYRLGGWIRTQDVAAGSGRGAQFNVHAAPAAPTRTPGVTGTGDWEHVEVEFMLDNAQTYDINALFGGWGQSTGTAWFDDLSLVELGGGSPESRLAQLVTRIPGSSAPAGDFRGEDERDVLVINLGTEVGTMRFDREEIRVGRGQAVRIVFFNTDQMDHNLLIIRPGTLERVGNAADVMSVTLEGRERQYVPDMDDVLHATPMLSHGEEYTLEFTAPDEPGEYPYVCTFPGHWRIMNGIMIVE